MNLNFGQLNPEFHLKPMRETKPDRKNVGISNYVPDFRLILIIKKLSLKLYGYGNII